MEETRNDNTGEQQLQRLFDDFRQRASEISEHSEQVQKVSFSAQLKNGTSFAFRYDSDAWEKKHSPKPKRGKRVYNPASPFNAVVDIIGAFIAVALMVLDIARLHSVPGMQFINVITIFTYISFIGGFVVSSVYHFFPEASHVRIVFYNIISSLKTISLLLVNIIVAFMFFTSPLSLVQLFVSIFIAALAFFFLSLGTKGGHRASKCCLIALPFIVFIQGPAFAVHQEAVLPFIVTMAIMFSLWTLFSLLIPSRFSGKAGQGKSNNIFPIMGMGCLYFLIEAVMRIMG